MKIVIRADSAPDIGAGHVMRCLALAQALYRESHEVILMGRIELPWLQKRLSSEPISVCYLEGGIPSEQAASELLEEVQPYSPDWVVLDGYHFSYTCQKALMDSGVNTFVLDDYNHQEAYCCDILLNQNIGAERYEYNGKIGRILRGVEYSLLRQEVIDAIPCAKQKKPTSELKNILVTLGGGDMSHKLSEFSELFHSPMLEGTSVRILTGGTPVETWRNFMEGCPAAVAYLDYVDDMPEQMLWADFCITAGGSTCWELCALNVPFAAVAVAENQEAIVSELIDKGYACSVDSIKHALKVPADRIRLTYKSNLVTDTIALYPFIFDEAVADDCDGVYAIANDPLVRAVSLSSDSIPYANHVVWFTNRISNELPFFVLKNAEGQVVGYVRFEENDENVFMSIALSQSTRGRSLGTKLLRAALVTYFAMDNSSQQVWAFIKHENVASQRLFTSCNFIKSSLGQDDPRGAWYIYTHNDG